MKKALFLISFLLAGCTVGDRGANPPTSDKRMVTLQIAVPASARPASRGLSSDDEQAVREISVLAFDATSKVYKGRYAGAIVQHPASGTMTFQVALPTGDFDFMVAANANHMLGGLVAEMSRDDVLAAVKMNMTTGGWAADTSDPAHHIPMWGIRSGVNVPGDFTGADTSLSAPISLTRMVAKVDVALSDKLAAGGTFELKSVRVYNYIQQGRLIPALDGSFDWENVTSASLAELSSPTLPAGCTHANPAAEFIDRTVADGRSLTGSIYLFEAPAGTAPSAGSSDYLNNPCLVIGGRYNGGADTYYKIDFAQKDPAKGWQYLPLMRNNTYSVTIAGIAGDGFATPGEAQASLPTNINATVVDWAGNDIDIVASDGVHMLGVSTRNIELPSGGAAGDTPDNLLTIVTDHPRGWKIKTSWDEAGLDTNGIDDWLQPTVRSSAAPDVPNGTAVHVRTGTPSGGRTEGWIRVSAGNIVLKVEVSQRVMSLRVVDALGRDISTLFFPANNGTPDASPTPQVFTVLWEPADRPIAITRTTISGVPALNWQHSSASLAALPAGGRYTFYVDPTALASADIAADKFFKRDAVLDFVLNADNDMQKSLFIEQRNIAAQASPKPLYGMFGQRVTIHVTANAPWTAKLKDGGKAVARIIAGSGEGNGNLIVEMATGNPTDFEASSLIELSSPDNLFAAQTIAVNGEWGHLFHHQSETWIAHPAEFGPMLHDNRNDLCPAGYQLPTAELAASMRGTVPMTAGRDFWTDGSQFGLPEQNAPAEYAWGEIKKYAVAYNAADNVEILVSKRKTMSEPIYTVTSNQLFNQITEWRWHNFGSNGEMWGAADFVAQPYNYNANHYRKWIVKTDLPGNDLLTESRQFRAPGGDTNIYLFKGRTLPAAEVNTDYTVYARYVKKINM